MTLIVTYLLLIRSSTADVMVSAIICFFVGKKRQKFTKDF